MTLAHLAANAPPNCVYRYYDHAGRILYVGVTVRGSRRQDEHNATSAFFRHVQTQQVEQCHDREEALRLERELIKAYRPPFNKVHNDDWGPLKAAYLAIVAAEEAYARAVTGIHSGIAPCDPCVCSEPDSDPCEYGPAAQDPGDLMVGASGCGRIECMHCHARFHGFEEGMSVGFNAGTRREAAINPSRPDPSACGHCFHCLNPDPDEPGACEAFNAERCEVCRRRDCLFQTGVRDTGPREWIRGIDFATGLLMESHPPIDDATCGAFDNARDHLRHAIRQYAEEAESAGGRELASRVLRYYLPAEYGRSFAAFEAGVATGAVAREGC